MPIPPVSRFRVPLFRLLGDGKDRSLGDAANALADEFKLTSDERAQVVPSSGYSVMRHRTGWAAFHLRKAGLLEEGIFGVLRITEAGKKFLATNPEALTQGVLKQFPAYREWQQAVKKGLPEEQNSVEEDETTSPEERIESDHRALRANLAAELLQIVKSGSPEFFERLVIDLLVKMGFGESREEASRATRSSGDGGIDGVIDADRLGLDALYVPAKRWKNSVGEPELRDFFGALDAHRATKGVFITTSSFSEAAKNYAGRVTKKISLIDGPKLASLMVDFGVGVSTAKVYELKKIDSDYFKEG